MHVTLAAKAKYRYTVDSLDFFIIVCRLLVVHYTVVPYKH